MYRVATDVLVMKLYHELKPLKGSVMFIVVILVFVVTITHTGFDPPIVELQFEDKRPTHTGSRFGSPSIEDAEPTVAFLGRL